MGQGASSQAGAYGQSIEDFYKAMETMGTGMPAGGSSGSPNANPYAGVPSGGGGGDPYGFGFPG